MNAFLCSVCLLIEHKNTQLTSVLWVHVHDLPKGPSKENAIWPVLSSIFNNPTNTDIELLEIKTLGKKD